PPEAVRTGGFRPIAYLCAKFLQTDGGLSHSAPASLLAPNASGRAPSLCGRCPASSLLRTRPSGSRLRRTSPLGSRGYLASVGFLHGARSPSLFSPMALRTCCRPLPRRVALPQIGFASACCLRRNLDGSTPGLLFTRVTHQRHRGDAGAVRSEAPFPEVSDVAVAEDRG